MLPLVSASADIAVKMGILSIADKKEIEYIITSYGLPIRIGGVKFRDIYDAHLHDKKFVGSMNRFVLPAKIGRAVLVDNVPGSLVRDAIKRRIL